MARFRKMILILCLSAFTTAALPNSNMFADEPTVAENQDDTMTLLITINTNSYTKMKNVPKTGFLEVYSILGLRVKRLKLEDCHDGASLELSNGLYILRAGKVAQKLIVR